jgi:hypothetical protein
MPKAMISVCVFLGAKICQKKSSATHSKDFCEKLWQNRQVLDL